MLIPQYLVVLEFFRQPSDTNTSIGADVIIIAEAINCGSVFNGFIRFANGLRRQVSYDDTKVTSNTTRVRIELHLWNVTENITAFINAIYNVNGSYVTVKSNEVSILVQGKQMKLSIYYHSIFMFYL